ncbi:MAG: excinuclease ABC subunit UvrA [Clostridia bacterium]|nr:excinuclease ABC subunit UvrA [Clostridia bacterium]
MKEFIEIVGARENNLKNINVKIPHNKLVLFTGLSGSGKSSLAFDTIFAEGQRRYMESLSSYARQFLGQMQKPNVEKIEGLSPAIAIDQKTTSSNPRSTVGTVTEIYDYFRLLFANIGVPYCPNCGTPISTTSIDIIVKKVLANEPDSKIMVLAPLVRSRKGEYAKLFEDLLKQGFVRVNVDGNVFTLGDEIKIDKKQKHDISVIVDRLILKDDIRSRLTESIETALKLANGLVAVDVNGKISLFNTKHSCDSCGFSFGEISSRLFSFNTPLGACSDCSGLGFKMEIDPDLVFKDGSQKLKDNSFMQISYFNGDYYSKHIAELAKRYNVSLDSKIEDLPVEFKNILLYGSDEMLDIKYESAHFKGEMKTRFDGIINNLYKRYTNSQSDFVRREIEKYMQTKPCSMCHGKRLNKQALSVKIDGLDISQVCEKSVRDIADWINSLKLTQKEEKIAADIIKEIKARCKFLIDVGLDYLTLNRSAGTLSGGEAQRIRLATQIGSGLVGVTYILDEPSIGLHSRDTDRLISTLKNLRDVGNTVIVVEHDEETIRQADYIVDVGPKAGVHGGEIVATGSVKDIINCPRSITGKYLSGEKKIALPSKRRKIDENKVIEVIGAKQNNLKNIDVRVPLGVFVAVTGVSGSGKSSLVNDIIVPALSNKLNGAKMVEGKYDEIKGAEHLDKVVVIDQSPIGRTPRSNPATYTGVFTPIRELFAKTSEARAKGYQANRFSFNVKGGRCEACGGDGLLKIEMHFLPDVYVTCDVCHGKRYNHETLQVTYKGKNINDVLEMTVEDALKFFENQPSIINKIQTLYDVGLGYIKLGQPATELSGGEAQRVKLATELSKRPTGKTLYVLDEPTTGLHSYDVDKLVYMLQRLVSTGNSVLVIEHNLDMIKQADYIIDMGPEGGDKGGKIVATGSPEEICKKAKSITGKYLAKVLW